MSKAQAKGMVELAVAGLLAILPVAGLVWLVRYSPLTTVDGLFTALVMLTISGVFALDVAMELHQMGYLKLPGGKSKATRAAPSAAVTATAAKPSANATIAAKPTVLATTERSEPSPGVEKLPAAPPGTPMAAAEPAAKPVVAASALPPSIPPARSGAESAAASGPVTPAVVSLPPEEKAATAASASSHTAVSAKPESTAAEVHSERGLVKDIQFFESNVGQANKSLVTIIPDGSDALKMLMFVGNVQNLIPLGKRVELTSRSKDDVRTLLECRQLY